MFNPASSRFLRSRQVLVFLICGAIGVGLASGISWRFVGGYISSKATSSQGPLLHVREECLHLGTVWPSKTFSWTIQLDNRGNSPLEITAVRASCSCTSISPRKMSIPPGQGRRLSLEIDLARNLSAAGDELFSQVLDIHYKIGGEHREWSKSFLLSGVVLQPFRVDPSVLSLTYEGSSTPDEKCTGSFDVTSVPELAGLTASCDPAFATVKLSAPLHRKRNLIVCTLNDALAAGTHRFVVKLQAVLKDGTVLPEYELPVYATVSRDIHAIPGEVNFGPARQSQPAMETITLQSSSGKLFTIVDVRHTSMLAVKALTGDASNVHVFEVSTAPAQLGTNPLSLEFKIQSETGPEWIEIPVRYYEVRPVSVLSEGRS